MISLYHALAAQHTRRLIPAQCIEQTITQLFHYLEDIVLENDLPALVVECLPLAEQRTLRESARMRALVKTSQQMFLFAHSSDGFRKEILSAQKRKSILLNPPQHAQDDDLSFEEKFIIIADAKFSAVLASVRKPRATTTDVFTGDEVIWSFEPDIVYSALEYLMARLSAEHTQQAEAFARAVRQCLPQATSLQLTLSLTTKLARLLQEQAVREIAVNRIAAVLRSSLELSEVLKTTINELLNALNAQCGALLVESDEEFVMQCCFRENEMDEVSREELISDVKGYRARFGTRTTPHVTDGYEALGRNDGILPLIAVPLIFQERVIGVLLVRDVSAKRTWDESEVRLLQTVADQVAVAVNNARLLAQTEKLALTDALTSCCNRRAFEQQLERDVYQATRWGHCVSLIMLDIDHFKRVNDMFGHDTGDETLRAVSRLLRDGMRKESTVARMGGEEFAILLPQVDVNGAFLVAERLRSCLEETTIPNIGHVTASFGVATFPVHTQTREELVTIADRALYDAKHAGRNRVIIAPIPESSADDSAASDNQITNNDDAPSQGSIVLTEKQIRAKFLQFLSPGM